MFRCAFQSSTSGGTTLDMNSSRSTHALMVECYLLYLQPWKARALAQGVALEKIESNPDRYNASYSSEKWLPYIAANLHFFNVNLEVTKGLNFQSLQPAPRISDGSKISRLDCRFELCFATQFFELIKEVATVIG